MLTERAETEADMGVVCNSGRLYIALVQSREGEVGREPWSVWLARLCYTYTAVYRYQELTTHIPLTHIPLAGGNYTHTANTHTAIRSLLRAYR